LCFEGFSIGAISIGRLAEALLAAMANLRSWRGSMAVAPWQLTRRSSTSSTLPTLLGVERAVLGHAARRC